MGGLSSPELKTVGKCKETMCRMLYDHHILNMKMMVFFTQVRISCCMDEMGKELEG